MFASEEPSKEYLMLESQIPKSNPVEPNAAPTLRSFFHGVCKLRARIKNFLLLGPDQCLERSQVVDSYLRAATRLEDKVAGWCDIPSWLPKKAAGPAQHQPYRTPWSSGSPFRLYYFESWPGFFHWNRYFVARICLHAALLDALAHNTANPSAGAAAEASTTIQGLISLHTVAVQETVQDFLGTLAYAFGDVDERGRERPVPTPVVSGGAAPEHRGINIPATLQIQPSLAFLVTLRYLGPGQQEAMILALQRVRAEFTSR